MKPIFTLLIIFVLYSCSSVKPPESSFASYDLLFSREHDGANFQFYEIITEEAEFQMLLKDPIIQPYLNKDDIKTCNFILVNLGEKASGGWTIKVEKVKLLKDKVEVVIKEIPPKGRATTVMTTPNFVLRIKSKKPIEIINLGN